MSDLVSGIGGKKCNGLTEEERIVCRLYLEDLDKYHTCNEYRILMGLLDNEPEREKGHWIPFNQKAGVYDCSVCGKSVIVQEIKTLNFCPNCGSYNGGER